MHDWLIWQLCDSAFPAGGFVHSGGLEAAWRAGQVSDGPTLERFIRAGLGQMTRGPMRFLQSAWDDPPQFGAVDHDCDLFLNNHIANRASRAQGRALLASSARIFDLPAIQEIAQSIRSTDQPGHLAPAMGLVTRTLHIDRSKASGMFGFMCLRGWVSCAVRLGIIGPIEGQQIQAQLTEHRHSERSEESRRTSTAPIRDPSPSTAQDDGYGKTPGWPNDLPVQTAPVLDLLQGSHDRLYSRLFQS